MKVAVVPAQVTTVEDRIAGNLGLSQIMLLATPVFGGSAIYALLPPVMHGAAYKVVGLVLLSLVCGLLATRIKGRLILFWLLAVVRYNLRPRYYIFDKRSLHGRPDDRPLPVVEPAAVPVPPRPRNRPRSALTTAERLRLQGWLADPAANVSFETSKKGVLYVRLTEINPES